MKCDDKFVSGKPISSALFPNLNNNRNIGYLAEPDLVTISLLMK